jgi:hypothetical protein
MLEHRQSGRPADQEANVTPGLAIVQPIQGVAGRNARLTARAPVEVDLEGKLLARPRWACREQSGIISALKRLDRVLVELREPLDGAQVALFSE